MTPILETVLDRVGGAASRVGDEAHYLKAILAPGVLAPMPPHKMVKVVSSLSRYGMVGGGLAAAAVQNGDRAGLVDELGTLTFGQLDRRSNALANSLIEHGLRAGDGV